MTNLIYSVQVELAGTMFVVAGDKDDAVSQADGWMNSMAEMFQTGDGNTIRDLGVISRLVPFAEDAERISKAALVDLVGADEVSILCPPKPKRCSCGSVREHGRRYCTPCRHARYDAQRERSRKVAAPPTGWRRFLGLAS